MTRYLALLAGLLAGVAAYALTPDSFLALDSQEETLGHAGRVVAGLTVLMAIWWMTEALPVYVTALLPLVVLPGLGVQAIRETAAPYAHELIFLFLGGFVLALAMERCGLHRRLALVALRLVGTRPRHMVGGLMLITAALSGWVSNTATALMMMPIAISLIDLVQRRNQLDREDIGRFSRCLLLGIAYAASIGGLATLIGSPPNGFVAGFMAEQLQRPIGFAEWMMLGVPVTLVLLPLTWWLLTGWLFRLPDQPLEGGRKFLRQAYEELGPTRGSEWIVLSVFLLTATLWLARPLLVAWQWEGHHPLALLTDAGIAITAAVLLFALPAGRNWRERIMEWDSMADLPWGLLILFGGGLSLAGAIDSTGLSRWAGTWVSQLQGAPGWVISLTVIVLIIFLTEITSNTATVAALVPVLAALAVGLEVSPMTLILPAALAGSCAFMLPVATPPNAIVFGTGRLTIAQMARAGLWVNLLAIGVLLLATLLIIQPLVGAGAP